MSGIRYNFSCPEDKRIRVIIDSDAGCECDDQYAILHGLMSQKICLRGIIAEQFGEPAEMTMEESLDEISRVMALAEASCAGQKMPGLPIPPPVYPGAVRRFEIDGEVKCRKGVDFLIKEALAEDVRPLFVIAQGALTNIAWALKMAPAIAQRMTVIVIGGINYPEGQFEFNTMNDPQAFNYVMDSQASVWMIPEEVYSTLQVSFMEIARRVAPCGPVGEYLAEKMAEANTRLSAKLGRMPGQPPEAFALSFPGGESWALGDSAGIGILLAHNPGCYKEVLAPRVLGDGSYYFPDNSKAVRWYERIDGRFILEDFFAKMNYYFHE